MYSKRLKRIEYINGELITNSRKMLDYLVRASVSLQNQLKTA